jgi:hypothetical protein
MPVRWQSRMNLRSVSAAMPSAITTMMRPVLPELQNSGSRTRRPAPFCEFVYAVDHIARRSAKPIELHHHPVRRSRPLPLTFSVRTISQPAARSRTSPGVVRSWSRVDARAEPILAMWTVLS